MTLPQELRTLVNKSVATLGQMIRHELGQKNFEFIENLRVGMAELREASNETEFSLLQEHYADLKKLKPAERHDVAQAFTLMLELMNACENAYRTHRLKSRSPYTSRGEGPDAVIYVLTAHPTEARSPQNIAAFHQIQNLLVAILDKHEAAPNFDLSPQDSSDLLNLLGIAWRTSVIRSRSPKVKDEAEHIYSLLFRDDVLFQMISDEDCQVPFYVRSWVGGDKDGHPGVDQNTLIESLTLSRNCLLKVMLVELNHIRRSLELLPVDPLAKNISQIENTLRKLRVLKAADAKTILKYRDQFAAFKIQYRKLIGSTHPSLRRLTQLNRTFPALVVPLELRESSDVLMKPIPQRPKLAIYKMLQAVEKISRGGDPRWYTRGFIISMCESLEHIHANAWFQKKVFGALRLPIIPLFEESSSLAESDQIVSQMTEDKAIHLACNKYWDNQLELMVGYSDSSKEAGVLGSRLAISKALPKLEKICEGANIKPIFFHGSGGSIDRGGGSIEDQTAWWPKSALRNYKVTVQGEMVERSLASPSIAKSQFESIVTNISKGLGKTSSPQHNHPVLDKFAAAITEQYEATIVSPDFLNIVEAATPYTYLSALKIGSRPSKRTKELTVKGLRAIPWVLCWTQTRVLFQTWWGVGSAWAKMNEDDRSTLRVAFQEVPVFNSYIKALGFTLAKIDLNIWRMYLLTSGLDSVFTEFFKECELTRKAYADICGHEDLMWFKPWLGESINLRSSMIHPLNLLQILAKEKHDLPLLRLTVTGISSGMMTTG